MRIGLFFLTAVIVCGSTGSEPAQILTNHLGYDPFGPKRAVIRGTAADEIQSFAVRTYPEEVLVYKGTAAAGTGVDRWKKWRFWSLDFTDIQREGTYVIEAQDRDRTLRSFPFKIQKNILERFTISDVLFYFKGQRKSGLFDKADRNLAFQNSDRKPVDFHGGWYDASGDYGVHLSHLDFSSYFNPQQMPLAAFTIGRTLEILRARNDPNFRQIQIRLADELAYGADFLVRMKNPGGSFYATIDGYADNKRPEARRNVRTMAGGQRPQEGNQAHNGELLNHGKHRRDYCALVAAAELHRTTKEQGYADAAEHRASSLIARLTTNAAYRD